jgi:hypothetical protein
MAHGLAGGRLRSALAQHLHDGSKAFLGPIVEANVQNAILRHVA